MNAVFRHPVVDAQFAILPLYQIVARPAGVLPPLEQADASVPLDLARVHRVFLSLGDGVAPQPPRRFQGNVLDHVAVAQVTHGVVERALALLGLHNLHSRPGRFDAACRLLHRHNHVPRRLLYRHNHVPRSRPLDQIHDLVPHRQIGLRLATHIDLIVVNGVGRIAAPRHRHPHHLHPLRLIHIHRDLKGRRDAALNLRLERFDYPRGIAHPGRLLLRAGADADVDGAAIGIGEGTDVRQNGMQSPAPAGVADVEILHNRGPFLPRRPDVIHWRFGCAVGPRARKVVAQKCLPQRGETDLGQKHLRHPIPYAQMLGIPGIAGKAVGIGALNAMHTARILRARTVEEARRRAPSPLLKVGHLQRVEVGVLGVGNARLSAKSQPAHRHAVGGIGVGCDDDTTGLVNDPIGRQYVGRRSHLGATNVEFIQRDVEQAQDELQFSHVCLRRKEAEDVKAQSGGEFEPWQHKYLLSQTAILLESPLLLRLQPPQTLKQYHGLNLVQHRSVTGHRVVIGEGDNVEALAFGRPQNIQI